MNSSFYILDVCPRHEGDESFGTPSISMEHFFHQARSETSDEPSYPHGESLSRHPPLALVENLFCLTAPFLELGKGQT